MASPTQDKVQVLQRTLYRAAKADPLKKIEECILNNLGCLLAITDHHRRHSEQPFPFGKVQVVEPAVGAFGKRRQRQQGARLDHAHRKGTTPERVVRFSSRPGGLESATSDQDAAVLVSLLAAAMPLDPSITAELHRRAVAPTSHPSFPIPSSRRRCRLRPCSYGHRLQRRSLSTRAGGLAAGHATATCSWCQPRYAYMSRQTLKSHALKAPG